MAQEGVVIGNLKLPAYKGEKGDTGDAGKITQIMVQTLESTQNATAQNIGTESEAIIVLGIPRGIGISNAMISNDELVITLDNGTTFNLGNVVGRGIANAYLEEGQIYITYTDGTTVTAGYIYDDALIQSQLAEIEQAKDDAIDEVEEATAVAVGLINTNKTSAVSEMNQIKSDTQQLKTDTQNIKNDVVDIKSDIDDEKDYIDGVVADFEASEEELQYILGVLGDIEAIVDDINGYDNANEEEY